MKTLSLLIAMFLTIYSVTEACPPNTQFQFCLAKLVPGVPEECKITEYLCFKGFHPDANPPDCLCQCKIDVIIIPPLNNTCKAKLVLVVPENCKITDNNCDKGFLPFALPPKCDCLCKRAYTPINTCRAVLDGKNCTVTENDCVFQFHPNAKPPKCDCKCKYTF